MKKQNKKQNKKKQNKKTKQNKKNKKKTLFHLFAHYSKWKLPQSTSFIYAGTQFASDLSMCTFIFLYASKQANFYDDIFIRYVMRCVNALMSP